MTALKAALIDASSAILLYKADLFEAVAAAYTIKMVPAVFQEVTVAGRAGHRYFQQCMAGQRLVVLHDHRLSRAETAFKGLGAGERSTILAFLHGHADFVIIDDRKGALVCRSENIPYINALLCPRIIWWSGQITEDVSDRAFQQIRLAGRYGDKIVQYAQGCSQHQMAHFLPPSSDLSDIPSENPQSDIY